MASLVVWRLGEATREQAARLRRSSLTDGLTGVLNRRGLLSGFPGAGPRGRAAEHRGRRGADGRRPLQADQRRIRTHRRRRGAAADLRGGVPGGRRPGPARPDRRRGTGRGGRRRPGTAGRADPGRVGDRDAGASGDRVDGRRVDGAGRDRRTVAGLGPARRRGPRAVPRQAGRPEPDPPRRGRSGRRAAAGPGARRPRQRYRGRPIRRAVATPGSMAGGCSSLPTWRSPPGSSPTWWPRPVRPRGWC